MYKMINIMDLHKSYYIKNMELIYAILSTDKDPTIDQFEYIRNLCRENYTPNLITFRSGGSYLTKFGDTPNLSFCYLTKKNVAKFKFNFDNFNLYLGYSEKYSFISIIRCNNFEDTITATRSITFDDSQIFQKSLSINPVRIQIPEDMV